LRYAAIGKTGNLADASSATDRRDYVCPACGGRVFLRSGDAREPHFAHYAGAGKPECDLYFPSIGTGGASTADEGGESGPEELGLTVEQRGDNWSLLLQMPELSSAEFGDTSFESLREGFIEVFAGSGRVRLLSALDVRPGAGSARALVPPSDQPYRIEPTGRWPEGVVMDRWRATAAPLAASGTIFRFRGGEWVRLDQGSQVRWGEQLVLIADGSSTPPAVVQTEAGNLGQAAELRWRLWCLQLPALPSPHLERWIGALGYAVSAPQWAAVVLSVPVSFTSARVPCFRRGEPIVVELTPPAHASSATAWLNNGPDSYSVPLSSPGSDRIYMNVTCSTLSTATLEIAGEASTALTFSIVEPETDEAVRQQLEAVPRLRAWVGAHSEAAWSGRPSATVPRKGAIRIEVGAEGARVDVAVRTHGGRRIFTGLSLRDAERVFDEALPDASIVVLDAGNQGRLEFSLLSHRSTSVPTVPDRREVWLRSIIAAAAPGHRALPVFLPRARPGQRLTPTRADEHLLPFVRAISRRLGNNS